MGFVLDSSLRISSIIVGADIKQQLAGITKGVDLGKLSGFKGLNPVALQSITKFNAGIAVAIKQMQGLATAAQSVGVSVEGSVLKAANSVDVLIGKLKQAQGIGISPTIAATKGVVSPVVGAGATQANINAQIQQISSAAKSTKDAIAQAGPLIVQAAQQTTMPKIPSMTTKPYIPSVVSPDTIPNIEKLKAATEQAALTIDKIGASSSTTATAVTGNMAKSTMAAKDFGDSIFLAGKRYGAFLAATTIPFVALAGIREATKNVIDFDLTMVKLDQTLQPTRMELVSLRNEILDLSVATGTSANELGKAAVTLAQAGFEGDRLRAALEMISKVPLLPSLEGIDQATEGLIAIMGQFKLEAEDIPTVFDKVNEVAKRYAVTSGDLIEAIKRGGGAWSALGGNIDEFLAIITAAKQTTQESAETIGTGLRTISARITRPATLEFLRSIGVQTEDASGKVLSLYRILEQTSKVFAGADELRRRDIAESLGGLRQIGRVIAILDNFNLVNEALGVSLSSAGSVQNDVAKGMSALSKQIDVMKAKMNELVQTLAPEIFTPFIQFMISAGNAATKLTGVLSPLLKTLLAIGAATAAVKGVGLLASLAGRVSTAGGISGVQGVGLLGLVGQQFASGRTQGLTAASRRMGLPEGQLPTAVPLYQSPAAQLVGLGVVSVLGDAVDNYSNQLDGAAKSTAEFTGRMIKSTTMLVGLLSILRGQSVGQTLRGFAPGARGTGIGRFAGPAGAAVALIGLAATTRANQVETAITEKMDEVAAKIKAIQVPDPSNIADTDAALKTLVDSTLNTIKQSVEYYSGFAGGVAEVGRRLNTLVSGILSFDIRKIGEAFDPSAVSIDASKMVSDIFGQNLNLLHTIMESAVQKSGSDFYGNLQSTVQEFLQQRGMRFSADLSTEITNTILQRAGGWSAIKEAIDKQAAAIRQSRLDEAARTAARNLSMVLVPPTLPGQLITLGKAVDEVAKSITASVNAFDAVTGSIEGISAPKLPQQLEKQATIELLGAGRLAGLETAKPDLANYVKTTNDIVEITKKFVESISSLQAQATTAGKLEPGKFLPPLEEDQIDETIQRFIESQEIPDKLKGRVSMLLRDIGIAMLEGIELSGAGINTDKMNELIKKHIGIIMPTQDDIVNITQQELNARLLVSQRRGEFEARQLQREVGIGNTPETQFEITMEMLRRAGIRTPARETGTPTDLLRSTNLVPSLQEAMTNITREMASQLNAIYRAAETGVTIDDTGMEKSFIAMVQDLENTRSRFLALQAAIESLKRSLSSYDQFEQERITKQEEAVNLQTKLGAQIEGMRKTEMVLVGRRSAAGTQEERAVLDEQLRLMRETRGQIEQPYSIAKEIAGGPLEVNKEASRRLTDSLIESQKRLQEIYQRQINVEPTAIDKTQFAGISESMQSAITGFNETITEIFRLESKQRSELTKEQIQLLERQLGQIGIEQERIIAEETGLNDPFGANKFSKAVDKFESAVIQMGLKETPIGQTPLFTGTKANLETMTPGQLTSFERALFGGLSVQELESRANQLLSQQKIRVEEPGKAVYGIGYYGGAITGPGKNLSTLQEIRESQSQKTRTEGIAAIADVLAKERAAISPGTEEEIKSRILSILAAGEGAKLDEFQVTPAVTELFDVLEKGRTVNAETTNSINELGRSATMATTAIADLATASRPVDIATTQPSTGFVPVTAPSVGPATYKPTALIDTTRQQIVAQELFNPNKFVEELQSGKTGGGIIMPAPGYGGRTVTIGESGDIAVQNIVQSTNTISDTFSRLKESLGGLFNLSPVNDPAAGFSRTEINGQQQTQQVSQLSDLVSRIDAVIASIGTANTENAQIIKEAIDKLVAIEIPGIGDNTSASRDNTATLQEISGQQQALTETLADTSKTIQEGIGLKVESLQQVNVNVNGLTEAIQNELRPAIEDAAKNAAKQIIYRTLRDLANASDMEGARIFGVAAQQLA
jgi:TP901 family phage tail tape measure protein